MDPFIDRIRPGVSRVYKAMKTPYCAEIPLDLAPREKILARGASGLSDIELVQNLLGTGTREKPVRKLASEVLSVLEAHPGAPPVEELMRIHGVGDAKISILCSAVELSRRLYYPNSTRVRLPIDVFGVIRHYADRRQERFLCLTLNGAHELIRCRVVSVGLINRTLVHPREVYASALEDRACAIVVAHNHPSGNLDASDEDREITQRLKSCGEMLGIPLLDHIIFSEGGFASLLERGMV